MFLLVVALHTCLVGRGDLTGGPKIFRAFPEYMVPGEEDEFEMGDTASLMLRTRVL